VIFVFAWPNDAGMLIERKSNICFMGPAGAFEDDLESQFSAQALLREWKILFQRLFLYND
jgi:hypothetical protein